MTSDREGKTRRTAVTGPSAERENLATLFALFLAHLCLKMFLTSLDATLLDSDADSWHWITPFILTLANIVVHCIFHETRRSVTRGFLRDVCQWVCGVAVIVAYNFWSLPSAKTGADFFRVLSWYIFLLNSGCLVELKLGLVQRCVYALADI